jgi:SAM-dependent methyltransferase
MDYKMSLDTGVVVTTKDFYSELGKRYEDAFAHNPGLRKIMQRFLSLLPSDTTVLDVGCGTGKPVSFMIAESGRRPYGIDLSPVMVELSKKQVPQGTFQQCNMLHFAPSPASFGGATTVLSLFGLSRAEITLMAQKLFQWIQPGGVLLIGVFGAEDCKTRAEQYDEDGECAHGIESTFMAHKSFMTLFTKPGWNKLLEGAGFEIVHTETDVFITASSARCDDDLYYYVIAKRPSV